MSNSTARSYLVAARIGAVEALKDQGFARWNYTFRSLNQHLKSNIRRHSYGAAKAATSSSSASKLREMVGRMAMSKEEKLEKVREVNCWGPSTSRF